MKTVSTLLAAAIVAALSICMGPMRQAAADTPAVLHARALTITAVVVDIDPATRAVLLRGPGGRLVAVVADDSVRNFDQMKKGDKVQVAYLEAVAIQIMAPEAAGTPVEAATVEVAPLGDKPGMVTTKTEQDSVVIKSIDYANRLAVLQMPDGTNVTVELDPHVQNLANVKAGDHVVVRRTRAVAISVHE